MAGTPPPATTTPSMAYAVAMAVETTTTPPPTQPPLAQPPPTQDAPLVYTTPTTNTTTSPATAVPTNSTVPPQPIGNAAPRLMAAVAKPPPTTPTPTAAAAAAPARSTPPKPVVSSALSAAYKAAMKALPPQSAKSTIAGGKKRAPRATTSSGKRKAQRTGENDSPSHTGASDMSYLPDAPVTTAPVQIPVSMQYSRLDVSDIDEARALGLLNPTIVVSEDASSPEYGVAYEKRGGSKAAGCGTDVFPSQKALQERCKQFAMERGFQLYVSGSSSRADGGGNVKYRCKKLHGQQFFDPDTPVEQLQCPFYVNGFGLGPAWKITRACFLHNHYKFIGSRLSAAGPDGSAAPSMLASGVDREAAVEGGGDPNASGGDKLKPKPQRNTTLSTNVLCRMVNEELDKYPSSAIAMSKLDGKLIKRILLSRGHTINHMMASRIKRQIQMNRIKSIRSSFQRLQGYLDLIVEKNVETTYLFDADERGGFKRAMAMPAPTLHAMKLCQKVLSFDRIRPMVWGEMEAKGLPETSEDESDDAVSGVYLYAATKDHNDQVLIFAVALVTEENQENWMWFMSSIQNNRIAGMGPGWKDYTIFAGRTNGLQQAAHAVFPHSSHHLCVRRLVEEELVINKKLPLPEDKKQRIYDLARCESEAEYKHIRQELALTNEAVVNFLDSLNRATWVKYAFLETFKKPMYGIISSDLSAGEDAKPQANTNQAILIKGANPQPTPAIVVPPPSAIPVLKLWFGDEVPRSSQPLAVFNRYFMKIAENFHARRKLVEQRPLPELVPRRFAQLESILQGSQRCESVPCSNGTFMVRSLAHLSTSGHDTWRHVNLLDWECTCLDWQDRLFPCVHGIHAAELNRRRIDSLYNGKMYSVEHYKTCYEVGFTPWPLESSSLPIDEKLTIPLEELYVLDPNIKRKPGPRPKPKKVLSKIV